MVAHALRHFYGLAYVVSIQRVAVISFIYFSYYIDTRDVALYGLVESFGIGGAHFIHHHIAYQRVFAFYY